MHRARLIPTLSLLATLAHAPTLLAQPARPTVSQADRDRARELALQGINAFNRNDYATVIDRFEAAERSFHAPVHLRFLAIAYERATPPRLLDAADAWRRLSQEQLAPDAPQPFRDAVDEARRELPRVEAQLGHVSLDITNGGDGMVVEIDGRAVPADAIARPQLVAPGEHIVTARRPGHTDVQRSVRVAAGATEQVAVRFEAIAQRVEEPPPPPPPPPQVQTVVRSNPLRAVGFALAGVGGAALIGGIITGVMASGAYSDLQAACPNNVCRTQADLDQRDTVDGLAGATNALLIGGGVLAAAGVVMIVVGRPRTETVQVAIGPRGGSLTIPF